MPRYITDDDTFRVLSEYYHHRTDVQRIALSEAISKVPTANVMEVKDLEQRLDDAYKHGYSDCFSDVQEVKHGRWMFSLDHSEGICTVCQYKIWGRPYNNTYLIVPYNYCPNCGSKMDGKETEEV